MLSIMEARVRLTVSRSEHGLKKLRRHEKPTRLSRRVNHGGHKSTGREVSILRPSLYKQETIFRNEKDGNNIYGWRLRPGR